MRLRLVLPRGRRRAGLGSLRRLSRLAAPALLAALHSQDAAARAPRTRRSRPQCLPTPRRSGLRADRGQRRSAVAARLAPGARRARFEPPASAWPRCTLVTYACSSTGRRCSHSRRRRNSTARSTDALARSGRVAPTRAFATSCARSPRSSAPRGRRPAGLEVVLDLFGTPAWAARPAGGCELEDTQPFSRPVNAAGLPATAR